MAQFTCYVSSLSGRPVADCKVRVVAYGNLDRTAQVSGGQSPIITGTDGWFRNNLTSVQEQTSSLPAGYYALIGIEPSYQPYLEGFEHPGGRLEALTIVLTPFDAEPDSAPVAYTGPDYVSPMYPVELSVPALGTTSAWELIQAIVTDKSGQESKLEVPVSDGKARLNLQARLRLKPTPHLVPDAALGLIDPDFSGQFTTTFSSLTSSGERPIAGAVSIWAANAFPDGPANDLTNYTDKLGPARWITPWTGQPGAELPKFAGHYADAMIWLPASRNEGGIWSRRTQFLDVNRQLLTQRVDALPGELFTDGRAVRIRIPEAEGRARYARLTVEQNAVAQTLPLTIRYVNG